MHPKDAGYGCEKTESEEVLCLSNRTLVKVIAYENCISIKTVSRKRKSPQRFFISLDSLAKLEAQAAIYGIGSTFSFLLAVAGFSIIFCLLAIFFLSFWFRIKPKHFFNANPS